MSESEKKVYKIWCDAFKREDISVEDNFFEIGGDSLIGMKIVTALRMKLNSIEVEDFFEYQTIKSIATKIDLDYEWRE
ncbi:phosphopantetheine-binding protein [Lachnobacterium bovis]|uniref:Phosphopantetheine attachment site n=1 Tax=Lachnobacterium bovis DSM 14045 TaxID=1122142 RepID=A0A1H3JC92_9FIRM|nr:phosphopantetheine-binding protein [Lachnobacterium bovis]SDY37447.1 Phosphopantetheine attachment site [Lachnobacterium bovis DSM 14045]